MNHVAKLTALLSFIALGIVTDKAQGAELASSGVTGQVFIYVCPVVRPDVECLRPYQARLTVRSAQGQIVKRFRTDAEGRFQVFLKPGRYVVVAVSPNGRRRFPHASPVDVRVTRNNYTTANIIFDSGIR